MIQGTLRIDRWLWYARFFKSRTLANRLCAGGRVRLNGDSIVKSHATLKPGDVLTFPQGKDVRVIRVVALGSRRGPASEAQTLYEDLQPPQNHTAAPEAVTALPHREPGSGRPTKADRRATDRLRGET